LEERSLLSSSVSECLAIVASSKQNLLEWFTPSVMKKRNAVEEAKLATLRARTITRGNEGMPISLDEIASKSSNRIIPAKEIVDVRIAKSELTAFGSPRAGTIQIRTSKCSLRYNLCFGQTIVVVSDLLMRLAPAKVHVS
jgi:hypothetical protein